MFFNLKNMFMVTMILILSFLSSSSLTFFNEHFLMLKMDSISFWMLMIMLFLWVGSSFSEFIIKPAFVIMMIFLFFSFTVNNMTVFFLSFESTLIPILYTIIQDGLSQERLKASFYMFFYTIFSSLPLLFIIMMMNNSLLYSFDMMSMSYIYPSLFMMMVFAFLVKMPVFFFHAWLPKAHVEASTMGSVFLAGLLLKLGSYGLYRFNNMFATNMGYYILSLGIVASIISSMLCVMQTDLKVMIAFSSIVHMSMNLIILAQMKEMVEESFIMANLSHSLISAALFLGFGCNYSWLKSRSSLLLKGIFLLSPVFFFCWFIICFLNMSLPPSIGFIGEVLMTLLIISFTKNYVILAILMSILFWFVGIYCLMLFTSISHGKYLHKNILFFNSNNLCLVFFISYALIPLVLTSWF